MSEPLEFIYKIQPTRPEMLSEDSTPEEDRVVSEHFAYLKRLNVQGVVYLAGRTLSTDYSSFGIVILRVESEEAAHEFMRNDPALKK